MAVTNIFLWQPAGFSPVTGGALPTSPNNGFVTPWGDKRSAMGVGLSVVFYGGTPTGTLTVECSNAPEKAGGFGPPQNGGDDAQTITGSSQPVTSAATVYQWQIASLPGRWVRVRYVSAQTTAGLSANIYMSAPHVSP